MKNKIQFFASQEWNKEKRGTPRAFFVPTAAERAERLVGEIAALRARVARLDLAAVEERRTVVEERRTAAMRAVMDSSGWIK